MFDEFAKAIMGSNGGGDMYRTYATTGVVDSTGASGAGKRAAVQADIDDRKRREDAAAANAKKDLDLKVEQDAKDPGKAQMIMRSDRSGYDFFDGTGKPLNINQFSLLTGKRPDELLSDSDNPRDQKFVQDYKTMRELSNAWINGDRDTLAAYRAADPKKFNDIVSKYKNPQEMVQGFMGYYSDYYGSSTNKNTAESPSFGVPQPIDTGGLPKQTQKLLAGASLDQTMAPISTQAPAYSGGWKGIAEKTPLINRLTGQRDARRRYEDEVRANPWLQYSSAMGL